ncbi:Coronin-like protein crn1 [Loxospora ochrophaea]|nr:Coronin-like protein crn1 [Loxospora ochrophaea]
MAGRFVRASKYRHVFGKSTRKEQCYDNIRISKNAWDSNLLKANPHYLSVNWDSSGGGAFAVIPIDEKGKLPEQIPLFRGHTAVVLDTDWSPFNDSLVASGSDDGKAFIWKVPENFTLHVNAEDIKDVAPVSKLTGHSRKIGHVLFNPAAENILATSSGDCTIKIWDVEAGSPRLTLKHSDPVQSLSWSANGSLMVTTSRDKKLRIWDVRQEQPTHVVPGHPGAKNSRAVWMGELDRVATTGFSKMSDRQLGLWDIKNPKEPVGGFQMLDAISGVCMPFWDDSTNCLYLAGKGDGNIRYFEYENNKFEFLSEYKSSDPQRGVAFLPKRGVNMHENEIMRAFKTVNDSYIEPISFVVPRRSEVFQGDIYPPATGIKPAMSASEWFGGKEGLPPKIDLESVYAGEEPTEVPSDYKPPTQTAPPPQAPSPTKKEPEQAQPTPQPTIASRGPPPSMKEQTSSIANLASKFADKDGPESVDDADDSSSFEEVAKPVDRSERSAAKALWTPKEEISENALWESKGESSGAPASPEETTASAAKSTAQAEERPAAQTSPSQARLWQSSSSSASPTTSTPTQPLAPMPAAALATSIQAPASLPTPTAAATSTDQQPMQGFMTEIKALLDQQTKTMVAQSEKIGALTAEVDTLKGVVGRGQSGVKDERIRELERELEGLRR